MIRSGSKFGARARAVTVVAALGILAFALGADYIGKGTRGGVGRDQLVLAVAALLFAVGAALTPVRRYESLRVKVAAATAPDVVLRPGQVFLLAIGFAFVASLLETTIVTVLRFGFHQMPRASQQLVWMVAISNALVMLGVAAALLLASYAWTWLRSGRVAAFVFSLIVADTLLFRIPAADRVEGWAKWVLAAGIAVMTARALTARWARWERRLVPAVGVATIMVVCIGAATFSYPGLREGILLGRLPALAGRAPNIVMIILDTVRAKSLSLYGYGLPTTPSLVELARSSVVFDNAIAPSPWTLPSHASVFTGVDPDRLSANWTAPLDDAYPTLAEVLSAQGYASAGFAANRAFVSAEAGLARGFARFQDYPASVGEAARNSLMLKRMLRRFGVDMGKDDEPGRQNAHDINGAFLDWLDRRDRDQRFFVFLNYFDAHDPYYAPPPFDTLYSPIKDQAGFVWGRKPKPKTIESWTVQYDRSLTYLDHALGELFNELKRRGVLDNTIVVITSDHGEHLGEHGFMRHGSTLYRPVLHVPLLIRFPAGVPQGTRVREPVSLRDVPVTILELARLGADATLPGSSLTRFWSGQPNTGVPPIYSETRQAVRIPPRYPNAAADLTSLIADGYHFIKSSAGSEELYHFGSDPGETQNLIRGQHLRATRMRALLEARSASQGIASGQTTRP